MTAPPRADLVASAAPVTAAARVPPNDVEAERAVLGCLLLDTEAVHTVRDVLRPDDFYAEKHQHLYRAAVTLADRGEPIDMLTLPDQLERGPGIGRAGGMDYIAELTLVVPSAASIKHYADIVMAHAQRRRLISAGADVSRLGFDLSLPITEAVDAAEQAVFAVGEQQRGDDAVHIAPIVRETWALLERRLHENKLVHGVPTNFSKLDMLTQGLQPGELVILAARPSVGKTSFALNIARNAAVLARRAVVVFSLEMSKQSLVQRLICSEAKVDSYLLRTGQADPSAFQKIAMAMDTLTQADLWIDDSPALSVSTLRARARRMKAQHGIALIVVDYLQLMHGGRQDSRVQEVSDISSGLKAIAKELDVPVLALSQLSRESERRENKRPQLSDLRDSGCLVGSTPVFLPSTGGTRPIRELVGQSGFDILALNPETWLMERHPVERVFSTGRRAVFELKTQLGRRIRATANHRFLAFEGWRRLDELAVGQHLAVPRALPTADVATLRRSVQGVRGRDQFHTVISGIADVTCFLNTVRALRPSAVRSAERIRDGLRGLAANTNRDVIPASAWPLLAAPALSAAGMTTRALAAAMGTAYNGTAVRRANLSRPHALQLGTVIGSAALKALSTSDVYWDQIASITPAGSEDVFDLTVDAEPHNFVAADLVVHNSIEQDADVVLFLYREGLHNREVDRAKTDLIVAKNRNGPVDDLKLVFIDSQTAFREPAFTEAD